MKRVNIQADPFEPGVELDRLERLGGGAVSSFIGIVRGDDGLIGMTLEHYPGMTDKAIERIVDAATARWPLLGVNVIHRIGDLVPGDRIVFVGVASSHRAASLEATAFIIDWLKTRATFWKQESWADGRTRWVDAKVEDDTATTRWE